MFLLKQAPRHAALAALLCVAYPSSLCAQSTPEGAQVPAVAPSVAAPPALPSLPIAELKPVAPAEPSLVKLTLRAPETVTFVLTRDQAAALPERQCNGDCDTEVPAGTYRIALAHGLGEGVEAPGRFRLGGQGVLEGQYRSARPKRIAGGVILGAGLPTSLGLLFSGIATNASLPEGGELGAGTKVSIAVGAFLTVLTAAVGGYLVSRKDEARVRVRGPELEALTTPAFAAPAPALEPPAPATPAPVAASATAPAPAPTPPAAVAKAEAKQSAPRPSAAPKATLNADDAKELARHRRDLEDCIEREMVVRILIGADGGLRSANVPSSDGMTQSCLKTVFGQMRFSAGQERSVSFRIKPARDTTF